MGGVRGGDQESAADLERDGATVTGALTPVTATARSQSLRLAEAPCCALSGPKPTRICRIVEEVRCFNCRKKLAEADYRHLVIKCPRCGAMNTLKAIEPLDAPSVQKVSLDERDP